MGNWTVAEIRDYRPEIFSYRDSGRIAFRGIEEYARGAEEFLYTDPLGGQHDARCIAPGVFEYQSGDGWRKVKECIIDGQCTAELEPEEILREILVEHRIMIGIPLIHRGFATFEHRYRDPVSSINNWDAEQVFDENGNLIESGFRRAGALIPVESDKVVECYR